MDHFLIDYVDTLLQIQKGDPSKLGHIRHMLQNNTIIKLQEREYVERLVEGSKNKSEFKKIITQITKTNRINKINRKKENKSHIIRKEESEIKNTKSKIQIEESDVNTTQKIAIKIEPKKQINNTKKEITKSIESQVSDNKQKTSLSIQLEKIWSSK
ncbi:MAG: hypothetical protein R1F52_05210 [Candidatus Nitrosoabyssus spongiisocia]|nr:MAG: hypothetical protein R1F52_05210 [Nitrosopumilaceae archaeon AB1(1)]